jgi:hypothetical protein
MDAARQVAKGVETSTKVALLYHKRTKLSQQHFGEHGYLRYGAKQTVRLAASDD